MSQSSQLYHTLARKVIIGAGFTLIFILRILGLPNFKIDFRFVGYRRNQFFTYECQLYLEKEFFPNNQATLRSKKIWFLAEARCQISIVTTARSSHSSSDPTRAGPSPEKSAG
jgi:hypothetical protein